MTQTAVPRWTNAENLGISTFTIPEDDGTYTHVLVQEYIPDDASVKLSGHRTNTIEGSSGFARLEDNILALETAGEKGQVMAGKAVEFVVQGGQNA